MKKISLATAISALLFSCLQPAVADAPVLPITRFTPGAINPNVTQANIHQTICVSGFTRQLRPSSSYTTKIKVQQLTGSYRRYRDTNTSHFEEDHLIPLELGGAASNRKNLWPQPYATPNGARTKDILETKLKTLVCKGQLNLEVAQRAIATNWWKAYLTYAN